MRTTKIIVFLFCIIFLQGCGLAYQQNVAKLSATAKLEDYGSKPDGYQETIMTVMERFLIDPESVRYSEWKEPVIGTIPSESMSTTPTLCWYVEVYINAKNRLGGYTGATKMRFYFKNGKLFAYCNMSQSLPIPEYLN